MGEEVFPFIRPAPSPREPVVLKPISSENPLSASLLLALSTGFIRIKPSFHCLFTLPAASDLWGGGKAPHSAVRPLLPNPHLCTSLISESRQPLALLPSSPQREGKRSHKNWPALQCCGRWLLLREEAGALVSARRLWVCRGTGGRTAKGALWRVSGSAFLLARSGEDPQRPEWILGVGRRREALLMGWPKPVLLREKYWGGDG